MATPSGLARGPWAGTWAIGRVSKPEGVSEVQILGLWRQEQVDPAALVAVKEVSRPLKPTLSPISANCPAFCAGLPLLGTAPPIG